MAQNSVDFSIDPSGDQLLDNLLTPLTENLLTSHSGSSRPSYAVGKTVWVDTTSTPWLWKMFNGTNDIVLGEIDPTGLVFTPSAQVEVLNNFSASANPTVNDDSGDGYSLGSTWYYNGNLFRCVNATVGAAVWVDTGLQLGDLGALALKSTIDSASLVDNGILTYAKLASSAIASLADLIAGTASKLVDAATAKLTYLIQLQNTVVPTNTATVDLSTSIPDNIRRLTINYYNIRTNGTSPPIIQLGDTAFVVTGYKGSCMNINNSGTSDWSRLTTGFQAVRSHASANVIQGRLVFERVDPSSHEWTVSGNISADSGSAGALYSSAGSISLGSRLQRVRAGTVGGTDLYLVQGKFGISWEY